MCFVPVALFFLGPPVDWSRRRIRRHFPFLTRKGGVEPRHPTIILLQSQVRVPSPFPLDGSVARVSISRPVIRREAIIPNPPSIPVFLAESLADPYADLAEFWIFLCSTLSQFSVISMFLHVSTFLFPYPRCSLRIDVSSFSSKTLT